MSNSRKAKRSQLNSLGYLKIKNMYSPIEGVGAAWYKKTNADGKALHEAHEKRVNDELADFLQTKVNSLKETWKDAGYNDAECAMLEEAFFITNVKNKETLREDIKTAQRLRKEASISLKSRLDAND